MSIESLRKQWEVHAVGARRLPQMTFVGDELRLGADTRLAFAKRAGDRNGDFPRDERERIIALLSAAYRRPIGASALAHIQRAIVRKAEGEATLALVHLALAGLGRLTNPPEDSRRLFMADGLIKLGVDPIYILQALGIEEPAPHASVRKYSPDQPRVPKGNGRESGQWSGGDASGGSTTAATASSQRPSPEGWTTVLNALNPIGTAEAGEITKDPQAVRNEIVKQALSHVGSLAWSYGVANGSYTVNSNKCNGFVHDVLTDAGVGPGIAHGWFHPSGPRAGEWANANYAIPGWTVLNPKETPMPGDVVAQAIGYGDASGHVMIVGPNGTVIGTGSGVRSDQSDEGIIEQIAEPSFLGDREWIKHGPKVYRRWRP